MTNDDMLRNLLRRISDINAATEMHRQWLASLAIDRRHAVEDMIYIVRKGGSKAPQREVAALMGITQQRVSKILAGRD